MNYVKEFHINGVDTRQVPCIELHGKPNAATEGCVGVLGIDVDSPLHDVYKCVAVNGSIYTWELLSSGLSIMSSTISGGGVESVEFPYADLRTPAMYVVKIGDLILDKEGYLYQISSLNSTYCMANYCGTQIAQYGKSAYDLAKKNGYEGTEEEWLMSLEGEPGAYLGTEEPTDPDIMVWVDPSGEAVDVKSAYEYAQEAGYTGTKEEFAERLANIGANGTNGKDGFSPTISVSTITGGHRVTITDKNETKTVDVMDGKTPYIQNGYWYIDGVNTNVKAQGADGKDAELAQALGDSEDKAISQKVVTSHLTDHEKRIGSIEQELNFVSFVTDDSVAYAKSVPDNALTFAEVNKIGGMTYKDGDILRSAPVTEVESVGAYLHYTSPIPEAVKAIDGYGWGINESVYNYVDYENRQFVKRVGKLVFNGTEQLYKTSAGTFYLGHDKSGISAKSGVGLCSHLKYATSGDNCFYVGGAGIAIYKNDCATADDFKAYLAEQYANGTPVTIYYELAEPIITDISDILPDDNYIEVEGGGTVTMVNEHQLAVPSEITYQVKRVMV